MDQPISNEEIAAHAEGIADRKTSQRVLRAALMQPAVRERLLSISGKGTDAHQEITADDTSFADRAARLKASMRNAALAVAREVPASEAPATAVDRDIASSPSVAGTLGEAARRILQTGRLLLTLPCLAPATASSPDSQMHRQTVQTGDGVRIEFQQLPGGSPYRLRVIVDASQIRGSSNPEASAAPGSDYNVAYLTIEDSRGADSSSTAAGASPSPDVHVLVVPLQAGGRGFVDFVIGGAGAHQLPAPAGACRLISATLSQLPADQQSA